MPHADLCTMRLLFLAALPFLAAAPLRHDLKHPVARFDLPAQLTEVSGLTDVDANTVACLQDEEAAIYFIDLTNGLIKARYVFGAPGDMEGLTRVGTGFFALRSDGLVYRVERVQDKFAAVDSYHLHLKEHNIEGLGYDDKNDLVLITPKDFQKGEPALRERRLVFAFNPRSKQVLPEPVLSFTLSDIEAGARAKGIDLPVRTTPKGRAVSALKLRMASIAVDPISDHYFILSAADQLLLELDRQGRFVDLHQLDAALLPKPEGITFLPGGDMLISTEGKGTPPRLVRYAAKG